MPLADYEAAPPAPDQTGTTAGDFARTAGAGALDIGSNIAGLSRYFYEQGSSENGAALAQSLHTLLGEGADSLREGLNPQSKKLLESNLTSQDFWEHPLLATALKATGMAPSVVALAIPGGLAADALEASVVAGASGAALNAGAGVDEFYKKLDAMSDKDLQSQSPKYAALREMFDERTARAKFAREAQGWAPALNALIGAGATAIGPAGTAARRIAGGAGNAVVGATGRLGGGLGGAAEGAIGGAAQSGASDLLAQNADIEAGFRKDLDVAHAANAALEGGSLGGLTGGLVGAVLHGGEPAPASPPPLPDTTGRNSPPTLPTAQDTAPQPQVGRASQPPALPAQNADVGNPASAPTRSDQNYPKGKKAAKGKASAEITTDNGPTQAEAAGLETVNPAPAGVDVNAALARLQAAPQPQAPVTPPGNQAPPEVAQAIQRQSQPTPEEAAKQPTVPEQPNTLQAQLDQLRNGQRAVVMVPKGTPTPPNVEGLQRLPTGKGLFFYDPGKISIGKIIRAVKVGKENEILDLGPVSKPEVAQRVAAGEQPVAVTERQPDGTEVKAAAGTNVTAPSQIAALEATKTPGNTVQTETPQQVIAGRTGRVLRPVNENPEHVQKIEPIEEPKAKPVDENGDTVRPGKNWKGKAGEVRDAQIEASRKITDKHVPDAATEANYLTDPAHRKAVIARARAMVEEANKTGTKINKQLRRSAKGDGAGDAPSVQLLTIANDLVRAADKSKTGEGKGITDATTKFVTREDAIRRGKSETVLEDRRVEGDEKMNRRRVDETKGEAAPTDSAVGSSAREDTMSPEDRLIAKEEEEAPAEVEQGKSVKDVANVAPVERKALTPAEARAERKKAMAGLKPPVKNASREALRVDLNPTEAQKAAGNYKKGHKKIDLGGDASIDFTMENPKGSIRRGVGPDGKPWEAKMPADYGYARRTKGADGDHIDVTDLRHGKRHFVIDQLNHETGEFDEHKVFTRAKDEEDARRAYEASFSDGRGHDRIGNVHEVTGPELKEWFDEGDTTKPMLEHAMGTEDRTFTPPADRGVSDTLTAPDGTRIKTLRSDYLSNFLPHFDFSKLDGVPGTLAKFFQSRFQKLAEDSSTVVHVVTPEQMKQLWGDNSKGTPLGIHQMDSNGVSHVIVRSDLKDNGLKRGSLAHVVLHETAHAVTVREINENPAARRVIQRLAAEVTNYLMDHPSEYDASKYALTNAKEFIAEAFSNSDFQKILSKIPIKDADLRDYLGLNGKRSMSMWDMFRGFVKKAIQKSTGVMPNFDSVLDGIMKVGEALEGQHRAEFIEKGRRYGEHSYNTAHEFLRGNSDALMEDATDAVKRVLEHTPFNTHENGPKLLKLRTFNNIAEQADHFFGAENNPVRAIHNAIEKMRVTADKLFAKSEPLISKLVELKAKDAEGFQKFSSLLHDATVANVHPDVPLTDAKNAHLGKKRVVGTALWSKAQHPELARRFRELGPELQDAWHSVNKFFRDRQNEMSLGIINNRILKQMGIEDDALARRIHEGTTTDADRARVGEDMLDTITDASELSKIEGPYVPLIRRGDHVVKGDYKVAQPAGAKRISDNEFEFGSQKDAEDYAKQSPLQVTVKKVWVDEDTGETHYDDGTKVSAKDTQSTPSWRAEVQNRHVEFVQGRVAAERRAEELRQSGNIDVHKVVPREYEAQGKQATELSQSLQRLTSKLEKSEAYKQSTPSQQAALRQAVEEAAAASHGSTRISSKALPRRGVQGYSEDLVRNMGDYGESSSRYLAKLEHAPELEAGMKEMERRLKEDHSKRDQYGRTTIANEVKSRVNGDNGFQQNGKFAPIVKRAMAISFIDKLASPAYSVINAMQPGMVTMPYLAGRHGVGRSAAALGRAYSDISAGKIIKEGLKETARRFKGSGAPDDFITNAKASLKDPNERKMLDWMVEHGVVDPSAGMEVRALTKDYSGVGGKIDKGLGYLEGVTREMPRAIEAINRMTTALAAYRLERGRGASHDVAVRYAQDAVNNTQFNYNPTNAPPLFNHPLAKMAFQFKKYGQGIYQLIGGQIGKAYRNANPGDRAEAAKTLVGLAATHMAIAGALGLPTEPFKYLVMASGLVGGPQWADVEDQIRRAANDVLGKTGGEVFTRGLPRLINLDLSRVGLDSVTSFGEPRGQKESDVKTWLFDSISGPVAALGVDYAKAIGMIANGDFEKAAENMIPIKMASDTLRAYRQATEGKKNAKGQQTSAPYNFQETAMRVAGFGSGREAEEGAARSSDYRRTQEFNNSRNGLVNDWIGASPTEKGKAMAAITKWNQSQRPDDRITPRELTSKLKRGNTGEKIRGTTVTKHNKAILKDNPYNA